MDDSVHQLRYAWSEHTLLGGRGMGPTDSTLTTESLEIWDALLRDHVWAPGSEPAYTFLHQHGFGALIRKLPAAGRDGRPGSVAQVLLSTELTAQRGLGLTSWDGWDDLPTGPLAWHRLNDVAQTGLGEIRRRARALPQDRLAGLFAALLHAPDDEFTVLGESDPLAVLCALGDLLGSVPTFASDEPDDHRSGLPAAVFLRALPVASTVATRRRLTPDMPPESPALVDFAHTAIAAYVADGVPGIAAIRREYPPQNAEEARRWADHARFAPGILADLTRLPTMSPESLAGLTDAAVLVKLTKAARVAPAAQLAEALDTRLPPVVLNRLIGEAVNRIVQDRGRPETGALFSRLVQLGPLEPGLLPANAFGDLDQVREIAAALMTPVHADDILHRTARGTPFPGLVRWVAERAVCDPVGARIGYLVICQRAAHADVADLQALAARGALAEAIRRFSHSEYDTTAHLVRQLGALPRRGLVRELLPHLLARNDAALLHALDTVLAGDRHRSLVHEAIRRAYYRAHDLPFDDGPRHHSHRSRWRPPAGRGPGHRRSS